MDLPRWPGWHLIGSFESDVGSWILHHNGEAALLEVPEGLTPLDVDRALIEVGRPHLKYVLASHEHEDHLDVGVWADLWDLFPQTKFIDPCSVLRHRQYQLGAEPLWLVPAAKHSVSDVVTIFRGVAMTGDIELGTLESVNDEVPEDIKRRSMKRLADFPRKTGYHVHSIASAHLDDVRTGVDWSSLFTIQEEPAADLRCRTEQL